MEKLTGEFLTSCKRDRGRILRGETTTRLETFVDAAFAFAFTMLVISIDQIPRSPEELIQLSKDIPSFVLSALPIGSVWIAHSSWSRIFGLRDRLSVFLSLLLVVLVLVFVFVYPMKLIAQITVEYFSVIFDWNFLSTGLFESESWSSELVWVIFLYVGIGLLLLSLILIAFYQNTLNFGKKLSITEEETRHCITFTLIWGLVAGTALVSMIIASVVSPENIQLAGYVYFSLVVTTVLVPTQYFKYRPLKPS
tara:strand:- start:107 stop:862 length:756 start_codon:yes stop_codon:yes gene_type:complete